VDVRNTWPLSPLFLNFGYCITLVHTAIRLWCDLSVKILQ